MVANSGILSTLTTTASTQLVDKIDSPHSGLLRDYIRWCRVIML